MKKSTSIYFALFFITCMISCGPKVIYKEQKSVPTKWTKGSDVAFAFEVSDTTMLYDFLIDVETNEEFEYENLYVKINTIFPNKEKVEDIVSFQLFGNDGESLGDCSGSDCTVKQILQSSLKFPTIGNYQVTFGQHSRVDTLVGVKSFGVVIEESEKVKK